MHLATPDWNGEMKAGCMMEEIYKIRELCFTRSDKAWLCELNQVKIINEETSKTFTIRDCVEFSHAFLLP